MEYVGPSATAIFEVDLLTQILCCVYTVIVVQSPPVQLSSLNQAGLEFWSG